MKRHWGKILLVVVVVSAIILAKHYLGDYLTVESVKQHRRQLLSFISMHYIEASLTFVLLVAATGLCIPGALALTIAGGMMFGTFSTAVLVNLGATAGATAAFLIARSAWGHWFQERFRSQLARFNQELSQHGKNYLLILRMVPIAPFFVINYCAGVTKIPLRTFVWTTSVGIIPGSVIHAFVGHQLRNVNTLSDFFSWKLIVAMLLPPLFTLLPVIIHHLQKHKS